MLLHENNPGTQLSPSSESIQLCPESSPDAQPHLSGHCNRRPKTDQCDHFFKSCIAGEHLLPCIPAIMKVIK